MALNNGNEPSPGVVEASLAALRDIERRARAHARALPRGDAGHRQVWRGIAFRLGEARLVTAMHEVREVLHYPAMSRVPGAKSWVCGLANVRGRLLPVVDLAEFLGGPAAKLSRATRVLVVEHGGFPVGLVVDEMFGLKQFFADGRETANPPVAPWLAPLLAGCYRLEETAWGVFEVRAVLERPEFLQAAA